MSIKPLRAICLVTLAVFLGVLGYSINYATRLLAVEMVSTTKRIDNLSAASNIYQYMQSSAELAKEDLTLSAEQSVILSELLDNEASKTLENRLSLNPENKNYQYVAQLNQAKNSLSNNGMVDVFFVDQWLKNTLFQSVLEQASGYDSSQRNMAAALVLTSPRWVSCLAIMFVSIAAFAFSLGLIVAKIRQKNE